jgi:hypothetical protein
MTKPMELTPKQRRRGLDFAALVAALASAAFDSVTKKELQRVASSIRKRFGFSEAEKVSEVLRCIKDGASSVQELIDETSFVQPDIWRITKQLEHDDLIRSEKVMIKGTGRPTWRFFPKDKG